MSLLFSLSAQFPPGFDYEENFISEEEEALLLGVIRQLNLHTFLFRGFEAKRKVASYGYDYNFESRTISKGEKIPEGFDFLIQRVSDRLKIEPQEIAELLVIYYPIGAVMNWHRDAPPFDIIAGISLGTDCKFKLRPYDKSLQTRSSTVSVPVKRRSQYIMKDEVRSDWEHSIDKLKTGRFSITLRTLKK